MLFVSYFASFIIFILTYLFAGIYCFYQGLPNAFYQISPIISIIPAIFAAWILHKKSYEQTLQSFLEGVAHPDIIIMCFIFLLCGAFGAVTKSIGSVDATVALLVYGINYQWLLVGVFILAAFISTSIGTSMGTIATLGPLTLCLADKNAFAPELAMATIISGAMFGDNLSLISDTTIAAVMSQHADMAKKLKFNARISLIAGIITACLLFYLTSPEKIIIEHAYPDLLMISPYLLLTLLALRRNHVFIVLLTALGYAGLIGHFKTGYSLIHFAQDITHSFTAMNEIMILSMLVGGLSELNRNNIKNAASCVEHYLDRYGGQRLAQGAIALIVSLFDLLLANNTIAIILSGPLVKPIAKRYEIPPEISASWIDIFSCVFQGIIPYGAQVLLASSLANISPMALITKVYYCYILAAVAIVHIIIAKIPHNNAKN